MQVPSRPPALNKNCEATETDIIKHNQEPKSSMKVVPSRDGYSSPKDRVSLHCLHPRSYLNDCTPSSSFELAELAELAEIADEPQTRWSTSSTTPPCTLYSTGVQPKTPTHSRKGVHASTKHSKGRNALRRLDKLRRGANVPTTHDPTSTTRRSSTIWRRYTFSTGAHNQKAHLVVGVPDKTQHHRPQAQSRRTQVYHRVRALEPEITRPHGSTAGRLSHVDGMDCLSRVELSVEVLAAQGRQIGILRTRQGDGRHRERLSSYTIKISMIVHATKCI